MSFKLTAVAWNVGVDKSTDRLVLLALASKADDNGRNCFPSVDGICAMTLMNRKTVFAAIARLADRGLLSVRKRACTNSNEYVLHVDRWTENGSTENGTTQKRDNPKKVQQSSQKRDNGSTENGTTVVPKRYTILSILCQLLSHVLSQLTLPRPPTFLTNPSKW